MLISFLLFSAALGQAGRSAVQGTLKDPQGHVIAGATVTLTNQGKNFNRTQTTNQEGSYLFTAVPRELPPGYRGDRLQESIDRYRGGSGRYAGDYRLAT
jgi:hypothetical protein